MQYSCLKCEKCSGFTITSSKRVFRCSNCGKYTNLKRKTKTSEYIFWKTNLTSKQATAVRQALTYAQGFDNLVIDKKILLAVLPKGALFEE